MFYKPEHRRKILEKRKSLTATSIKQLAESIAGQLIYLPEVIEAQRIAFYMPHDNEVDATLVLKHELHLNKEFYLPALNEAHKTLSFYSANDPATLIKNQYGILEPDANIATPIDIKQLDLVIMPLVGFDPEGNRLGRGAGYYDRSLATIDMNSANRPTLLGLAYEFQKINAIEPAEWDIPLDIVVTETAVYRRRQ